MSRDDSASRILAKDQRRKRKNLRATGPVDPAIGAVAAGTSLLDGCCELAAAETCSPSSSGAWSDTPTCSINMTGAGLTDGQQIAWAAEAKLSTAGGEEVNAAGTLKKSTHGPLLTDDLSTLTNVVVEAGAPAIENGKLRMNPGDQVRFTGFTAAAAVSVQVTYETGAYPFYPIMLVGRMDTLLDGYGVQEVSGGIIVDGSLGTGFEEQGLHRVDSAVKTQLDVGQITAQGAGFIRDILKVYVADGDQKAKLGSAKQSWDWTATDTVHNSQTGTAGALMRAGATSERSILSKLVACPSDTITVTGMETGYRARVGSLTATESAGTATLDLAGTTYPAASLQILDDADTVVASITPVSGVYGGDAYEYDIDGLLGGGAVFDATVQVDLDFFDAGGSLISTASGATWNGPTYRRIGGTVNIPVGTRTITPTHRRAGTATAVSCVQRWVVTTGAVAGPWVPCPVIPVAEPHVVPTDEAMVLDLRFTEKYPKIDTDTNSAGSNDPKTDTDGTIALSRKAFDASVHGLHHHINTIDTWGIGPSGLQQDPNPLGDWVYDWPRPVPGVAGWGLRIPDPFDWNNVPSGVATNFNASGCVAYFAATDADIRGPNDEYNQMESFTYLMWFRPAIEANWNFYLAAVYDSAASSAFNATLGKTLVSEKAGWLWMYEYYPGSAPYEDHYISFTSNASGTVADIYYGSDDGGVCDPFFGEAADTGLHDIGLVATTPAFLALVVGADESGSVAVQMYLGNPRTGVLHDVATGVNYGTDESDAVPTPLAFTSADNQTQHVIGNIRQRRSSSLFHTQSDEGTHGVIDGCIRHNRALTAVEVRGAFVAGLRRQWERSATLQEPDVDNSGESAAEVP